MNLIAFFLAVAAVAVFLVAWVGTVRRPLVPLGLALLAAAWIVQAVRQGNTVHG